MGKGTADMKGSVRSEGNNNADDDDDDDDSDGGIDGAGTDSDSGSDMFFDNVRSANDEEACGKSGKK